MNVSIQPADLAFFSTLAGAGSLSAAGRELGITTAAVSKRLALMESRIGVPLVNRSTRRMSLTHEGELYVESARRILDQIHDLEDVLGNARATPRGLLRVSATMGFGRAHIAPLISAFVRKHPDIEARLQVSPDPPPLGDDSFDVSIRFGAPRDGRVVARRIAGNRRLLCASPAYLARRGTPATPEELSRHHCIGVRQGDDAYGLWRLTGNSQTGGRRVAIKTHGMLSTNDGEIAVGWALDGHGILMRAEWDINQHLASGRLVQVLPDYHTPDADVYAVFPYRHHASVRVRAFVTFLAQAFARPAARAGAEAGG